MSKLPEQVTPKTRNLKRRKALRKNIKRGVLIGVAGVAIAAFVYSLMPKPIVVDLGTAVRGPMKVTVNEDGKTKASRRYVLSAPLSGNMNRIRLKPGDYVEEGANILRIVPATPPLLDKVSYAGAQTRLAAAKAGRQMAGAEVARATAALEQAKRTAKRTRGLAKEGVASADVVEQDDFAVKTRIEELRAAEFSAKVREQDEASARAALGLLGKRSKTGEEGEGLNIPAPVSGEVLRVLREDKYGLVAAGAPLVEVADLSALEVVVDILTADAVHIEPGAKTKIIRWGGRPLQGHVIRVEPSAFTRISALGVEEQRVLVIVELDSPKQEWKSLGDGYRVEVEISIWESDNVLFVPASAAFRHEGQWALYTVEEDIAKLTPIEIDHRNDTMIEVTGGLKEGAIVVVHPSDRVVDGIEVRSRLE